MRVISFAKKKKKYFDTGINNKFAIPFFFLSFVDDKIKHTGRGLSVHVRDTV